MNNSTSAVELDPVLPEGGRSGGDVNSSVSAVEVDFEIAWSRLIFTILWLVAFIILAFIIFSYVQRSICQKNLVPTRESGDEENLAQSPKQAEIDVSPAEEPKIPMWKLILIVFTIAVAFSCSIAVHTSCTIVDANEIYFVRNIDNQKVSLESFGLWSAEMYDGTYESDNYCQSTVRNGFPTDGKIIFARVVSVLACVLGNIALISAAYFMCVSAPSSSVGNVVWFRRLSWLLFVTTMAQALVLVLLGSNLCQSASFCVLDIGGASTITASLYWFVACLVAFLCTTAA